MNFDLGQHDALFASRTPAAEWDRLVAFRSRPGFLRAVQLYEGVMQPFFAHNLILNKVVIEVWRFQMLCLSLYLHATADPDDPRTGLTVSNLQGLSRQLNLASPGRVYAFLSLMKLGGYLKSMRARSDARIVQMAPTDKFLGIVEAWSDNIFACIDAVTPEEDLRAQRARHPELGREMRTNGAERLLDGWLPLDPFPEVHHFAAVDGGWMLMEHIVSLSLLGDPPELVEPMPFSLNACAKRFGGSRANLHRLLTSAHELGLLNAPPRGGASISFTPVMMCAYLNFLASFLSLLQESARTGLRRILDRTAA